MTLNAALPVSGRKAPCPLSFRPTRYGPYVLPRWRIVSRASTYSVETAANWANAAGLARDRSPSSAAGRTARRSPRRSTRSRRRWGRPGWAASRPSPPSRRECARRSRRPWTAPAALPCRRARRRRRRAAECRRRRTEAASSGGHHDACAGRKHRVGREPPPVRRTQRSAIERIVGQQPVPDPGLGCARVHQLDPVGARAVDLVQHDPRRRGRRCR